MHIGRRIRGLVGSAFTWGAVGAFLGAAIYMGLLAARLRVWPISASHWARLLTMFGVFSGTGAVWGAVCGLAFGGAVWRLGRRWSFEQLSTRMVVRWGAVAGAAFPVLIYTPAVLIRGAYRAIPLFSTIALLSAVVGAGCANTLVWMARRVPELPGQRETLAESLPDEDTTTAFERVEREHVREPSSRSTAIGVVPTDL